VYLIAEAVSEETPLAPLFAAMAAEIHYIAASSAGAIFHLLEEPVPALATRSRGRFQPCAYRLRLPSDGLTIWYTVTASPDGQAHIVVQYVKADT
jgi:hypothetical protein